MNMRLSKLLPPAAHPLLLAVCVAVFVIAGGVSAADDVQLAKLSVADAVSLAVGGHARLQAAEKNYLASLSELKIANINTTLTSGTNTLVQRQHGNDISSLLLTNFTYESLTGTSAQVGVSPLATGNSRGAISFTVRKPLMQGMGLFSRRSNSILNAKSDVTVQDKQRFITRQETVLRVINAYYRAVLSREQVTVQEKALQIAEQVADSARKLVDAGYAAGIEASRAEIRVARTRDQVNIQKQAAKGAVESLMLAVGHGVGQTPELVSAVPDTAPEPPTIEEAMTTALANRPELAVADEQIANQQRAIAIAKDQLKPSLDMVAKLDTTEDTWGPISRQIVSVGAIVGGVEYRVPMDRRAIQEQSAIEARELESLRKLRTYQTESVAEEVGRAYRNVQTAKSSLEIFTQNRKVYEENYLLADRMMKEANGTNRDILDAQEALAQVEGSILSAKTDLYLATISLKVAMGEDISTIGLQ